MGVPGSANLLLLGGEQGYKISRSLRFNSADSAYLNRTPASAGNRKTWTYSAWIKLGKLGQARGFLAATAGTPISFGLDSSDRIFITVSGVGIGTSTAVFRDPSAWYHVVIGFDTTQGPTADRVNVHVNGTRYFLSSTLVALNTDYEINNNSAQQIGTTGVTGSTTYFDGLITEIHFVDGQVLNPSSFGETDTITGVWKPKKYAGTYGTNGFYLNFSDNSGTTSTTLGKDSSGNGNNWTPNNFSVTAGAGNDSMIDTPTPYADGGNGRGNYPTANPLDRTAGNGTSFSNGNLDVVLANASVRGTIGIPSSGKWYFEWTITKVYVDAQGNLGIAGGVVKAGTTALCGVIPATASNPFDVGGIYKNGSKVQSVLGLSVNDVFSVAIDMDALTLQAYRNGTTFGSSITLDSAVYIPHFSGNGTSTGDANTAALNFGQRSFAYTPPSGFKALNTQNLPEPSIKKPNQYFNAVTYTGSSSSVSVTGVGFQPDFIWTKARSTTFNHGVFDSVRGFGSGATKILFTNNTNAEATQSNILSVNSDGFTTGTTSVGETNNSGDTYVAWNWKESATPGFDIVTYTGDGTAGRTISHNLGVAPSLIIAKGRTNADNWPVGHASRNWDRHLLLNSTAAEAVTSSSWNNTAPTSSVFTVGSDARINQNTITYVAYLWSEVAGFSRFGSYTGNGSSDGPFVFCGFRPRWVMIKRTDSAGSWFMIDTARGSYNVVNPYVMANVSNAEATDLSWDILSNGFKLRSSYTDINTSSGTYVFAAFSESAFKYALAR